MDTTYEVTKDKYIIENHVYIEQCTVGVTYIKYISHNGEEFLALLEVFDHFNCCGRRGTCE